MPNTKNPWPPPYYTKSYEAYEVAAAWYSGDPMQLGHIYGSIDTDIPQQYNWPRKLINRARRWFWGQTTLAGEQNTKMHTPAASDIAATSANILFGKPPEISLDDENAQAVIDRVLDDEEWAKLIEAAELCAALGDVYLRVGWDLSASADPILSVIHPANALPVFKWGELDAVTLHHVVAIDSKTDQVTRHLELHEVGRVTHTLWLGSTTDLGEQIDLGESPVTAAYLDSGGLVDTGLDQLDVVWVPNMRPNRYNVNDPHFANLGQSDTAGLESLMDALDEAYSSWRRDVRQGKARLMVPQHLLRNSGRGKGGYFDSDTEVYVTVEALPGSEADKIEQIQFAIRVAEHRETVDAWWDEIVSRAGYSPQTFGKQAEHGVIATATEVTARERRTVYTREKKIRYWSAALRELVVLLLEVSNNLPGSVPVPTDEPTIEFPSFFDDGGLARAQEIQLLDAAGAISTETKIRMAHPEWTDVAITLEMDKISSQPKPVPPVSPPAQYPVPPVAPQPLP